MTFFRVRKHLSVLTHEWHLTAAHTPEEAIARFRTLDWHGGLGHFQSHNTHRPGKWAHHFPADDPRATDFGGAE